MANPYKQKKSNLARNLESGVFPQADALEGFCDRLCSHPFPKSDGAMGLWFSLWSLLSTRGQAEIALLPNPCLNHIESRYRKPERARTLDAGLSWLLVHDEDMFLEGLRLYPHALCRTAETIGTLDAIQWRKLEESLRTHRLWQVEKDLTEQEFWNTAERLIAFRDLPQSLLDFLDLDQPREDAPITEFIMSLQRYLLRKRIEKVRSATYEALRVHSVPRVIEIGSQN